MSRINSLVGIAIAVAGFMIPLTAFSQAHNAANHSHPNVAVDCTNLATPPWDGLPEKDRLQMAALQQEFTSAYNTPEAAKAAGFMPFESSAIPGMGVHYVSAARMQDPIDINAPDHLMFASIDGQDQLVGAAFVFIDLIDADKPILFDNELAKWHDHPGIGQEGRTLHMLHIWFVPSSNGPFAGLNFWLGYQYAGVAVPSSCWMAEAADAERIRTVSFALVPPREGAQEQAPRSERTEMIAALDAAARAVDHDAWVAAADRFIADLSETERNTVSALLGVLNTAQMSSAERDAAGIAQPGRGRDRN
jgi:hypothetical protein